MIAAQSSKQRLSCQPYHGVLFPIIKPNGQDKTFKIRELQQDQAQFQPQAAATTSKERIHREAIRRENEVYP